MSGGVLVGGKKYQFLREDDKKIAYAKKKDSGALTLEVSKTGTFTKVSAILVVCLL